MDWFKEDGSFDNEYSSEVQLILKIFLFFFVPMFNPKANMVLLLFYQLDSYMYVQYHKVLV